MYFKGDSFPDFLALAIFYNWLDRESELKFTYNKISLNRTDLEFDLMRSRHAHTVTRALVV